MPRQRRETTPLVHVRLYPMAGGRPRRWSGSQRLVPQPRWCWGVRPRASGWECLCFPQEDELAPSLVFFSVPASPIQFWDCTLGCCRCDTASWTSLRCCGFSTLSLLLLPLPLLLLLSVSSADFLCCRCCYCCCRSCCCSRSRSRSISLVLVKGQVSRSIINCDE